MCAGSKRHEKRSKAKGSSPGRDSTTPEEHIEPYSLMKKRLTCIKCSKVFFIEPEEKGVIKCTNCSSYQLFVSCIQCSLDFMAEMESIESLQCPTCKALMRLSSVDGELEERSEDL